MTDYCMILTTASSKQEADKLTKLLLNQRLASCVQQININSSYHWQGKIEKSDEILLQVKTKKSSYSEVEKTIKENHSYQTPQIIEIPITNGSKEYLQWIKEETK